MANSFDMAVVGAGIVGLAHAWAAARLGKRVVVIDRDTRACGASVRNFGFITVSGQQRGATWARARRTRDLWRRLAVEAGIAIEQQGLTVTVRHPEAMAVLEAFAATEMGEGCALWSRAELQSRAGAIAAPHALGALHSPHDLRVDSRAAVPRLAAFLAERHGVEFRWNTSVLSVAPPVVETSRGPIAARAAVVCPGDDRASLFPEAMAARGVSRCVLSMLRLEAPTWRLIAPLMSDLSLIRYAGWAELAPAAALRVRLEAEIPEALAHGVHLIAVAGGDGSLIIGDSHHYGESVSPFMNARTEALILQEFAAATGQAAPPVIERWSGTYAHVPDLAMFAEAVAPDTRLVVVTGGTGASTAFAIAEEVVGELFGVEAWT